MLKILLALPEPADHVVDLAPRILQHLGDGAEAQVEPVIRARRDVDEPLQALDGAEHAGDAMQPRRAARRDRADGRRAESCARWRSARCASRKWVMRSQAASAGIAPARVSACGSLTSSRCHVLSCVPPRPVVAGVRSTPSTDRLYLMAGMPMARALADDRRRLLELLLALGLLAEHDGATLRAIDVRGRHERELDHVERDAGLVAALLEARQRIGRPRALGVLAPRRRAADVVDAVALEERQHLVVGRPALAPDHHPDRPGGDGRRRRGSSGQAAVGRGQRRDRHGRRQRTKNRASFHGGSLGCTNAGDATSTPA